MTAERAPRPVERRRQTRTLAVLVIGLVALASLPLLAHASALEWPRQWLVAVLVAGATAFGALHVLAADEPNGAPLATLVTPALVALAAMALPPLAGGLGLEPNAALLVALGSGAVVLVAAIESEVPFVREGSSPSPADRRLVEAILLGCAFVIFAGLSATLPAGWVRLQVDAPGSALPESVVPLAVGSAVVALFVGWRLGVLAGGAAFPLWASGLYAVSIGLGATLFRWLAIPGPMSAALLALVLYLAATIGTARTSEGTARWRLEVVVVGLVLLVAVGFRLFVR